MVQVRTYNLKSIFMKTTNVSIDRSIRFLSDYYEFLPSKCLLNKGLTGVGGTHVELTSNRNSIILVPTINLVINKTENKENIIGVHGDTSIDDIRKYVSSNNTKKIVSTYDSFKKVIEAVGGDIYDYFLLIDEYHILFNNYKFRHKAISYILRKYAEFNNYCFMTATPLTEETILDELKYIDIINLEWERSIPVSVTVSSVPTIQKELNYEITKCIQNDYNLHIFINSIKTIRSIVNSLCLKDFRTVCSESASYGNKKINPQSVNSSVKKINFYTSTAFEGVDIWDPIGKTIIVSDTNVSSSMLDISTLVVQIAGRLRDSIYKDEILFIVNPRTHRYLHYKNESDFYSNVGKCIERGHYIEEMFKNGDDQYREKELFIYSEKYWDSYAMLDDDKNMIKYEDNLKNIDIHNYNLVTKLYNNTLSVIDAINDTKKLSANKITEGCTNPLIIECMSKIDNYKEYTSDELREIIEPVLIKAGLTYTHLSISKYLTNYNIVNKNIDKKRFRVYKFRF